MRDQVFALCQSLGKQLPYLFLPLLFVGAGQECVAGGVDIYLLGDAEAIHLTDDPDASPATLVGGARGNSSVAASVSRIAKPDTPPRDRVRLDSLVAAAAVRHGVSAGLIDAVIAAESAYQANAVSARGALGLMQLMPTTARGYGVADAFDAAQNIEAGTRHLRVQIDRFRGDTKLALAAYNAGAEAVARHGNRVPPYAETTAYVSRVLAHLSTTSSAP